MDKATGLTDKTDMALNLLGVWTSNSTFNVNTYAGDVIGVEQKVTPPILSGGANASSKQVIKNAKTDAGNGKKYPSINSTSTRRDLAAYIWSTDQSPSDDSMKPNGKGRGAGYAFVSSANFGVQNNSTFSTQSVALLLQSSFDDQGAHFYAYNIAPSGAQGKAKNLSTVKTEWRSASLVGDGMFGQFASFFEMVAESLSHSVIVLAATWALLTIELVGSLKTTLKRFWTMITTLQIWAAPGFYAYSLAIIIVGIMTLEVPEIVVQIISTIVSLIPGLLGSDNLGAPIQLLSSVLLLGATYLITFVPLKNGGSIIKFVMSFPLEFAKQFDEQAMKHVQPTLAGEAYEAVMDNDGTNMGETSTNGNSDSDNGQIETEDRQQKASKDDAIISNYTGRNYSGNVSPTPIGAESENISNVASARKHDPQSANVAKLRRQLANKNEINGEAGKNKDAALVPGTEKSPQINGESSTLTRQQILDEHGRPITTATNNQSKRNLLAKDGMSSLSHRELATLKKDQFNPKDFETDVAKSEHLSDIAFNEKAAKDKLAAIDDGKYLTENENGDKIPDLKAITTAMKIGDSPYATDEQRETAEKLKAARTAGAQSLRQRNLMNNGYDKNGKPVLSAEESENILTNANSKKDFDALFDENQHLQDVATSMPSAKKAINNLENSGEYYTTDQDGTKHLDLNHVHEDMMAGTQPNATPQQKQLSSKLISAQQAGKNEMRHNAQKSVKQEIKSTKPGILNRVGKTAKRSVDAADSGSIIAMLRDGSKTVTTSVQTHQQAREAARKQAVSKLLGQSKDKKK